MAPLSGTLTLLSLPYKVPPQRIPNAPPCAIPVPPPTHQVKEKAFLTENVTEMLTNLTHFGVDAVAQRRAALDVFRADVIYDAPGRQL